MSNTNPNLILELDSIPDLVSLEHLLGGGVSLRNSSLCFKYIKRNYFNIFKNFCILKNISRLDPGLSNNIKFCKILKSRWNATLL